MTINPSHRLVEGIATDGRTIWVSSVLDRQILVCRTSCRTLATLPAGVHPFAIAWDKSRRRLWVAADCPPGVKGIVPCDRGALIGLDSSGHVQTRIAPFSGSFHPGDVSAGSGGVFVSDSQNGAVYRLSNDSHKLTVVVPPSDGGSAQGTALDGEAKRLLVSDYSHGLSIIDLATGDRTFLPRDDGRPHQGIDGMTRCGSVYYGIYNGATPGMLVSMSVNGHSLSLDKPFGEGSLPDPTQVTFDGKRLLIVADSGWATLDKPDFVRTAGATIIAVPLSADCEQL